jgi:hypothetical protein
MPFNHACCSLFFFFFFLLSFADRLEYAQAIHQKIDIKMHINNLYSTIAYKHVEEEQKGLYIERRVPQHMEVVSYV